MSRRADPGARRGIVRLAVRLLIVANAFALAVLSLLSAANYGSVVIAHATVYVVPGYTFELLGTDPDGTLRTNGTVLLHMALTVENPSGRSLRLHLVAFRAWIEDLPAEAGLPVFREPADDPLVDANGTRLFYPAFLDSREVDGDPIPPSANWTLRLTYALDRVTNPWAFDAVQNITDYAAATRGSATDVPWNHWVRVQIDIEGVPEATSPTAAAYVRTLRRIEREEGINLGTF
jgi:hypothetical protein